MRQWHFQLFLDGPFVELASSNPTGFAAELERRWVRLQEGLGAMHHCLQPFLDDHYRTNDLYVTPQPYTNQDIANEVVTALSDLRFGRQGGYASIKLDDTGIAQFMPTPKRLEFLALISNISLLAAIGVTVAFVCVDVLMLLWHAMQWGDTTFQHIPMILLQFATFFTAVSAGSRALKAGATLPEEIESYDHYRTEVIQLRRLWDNIVTNEQKFAALAELEREAARELRRFLRIKARATFIL
jgi:hypothetical protein